MTDKYIHSFILDVEDDLDGNYKITYRNDDWFSKTIVRVPTKKWTKKFYKLLSKLNIHKKDFSY